MKGILMKQLSLVLLAALVALSACDSKDKKVEKPAELTDIKNPTVRIQKLWGASVGGGGKKLRLGLGLATAGNKLFAAGRDGDVAAFDLKSGKQLWRVETKLALAGGTGVGADIVAVGSADGQVLAFAADNGAKRWRARCEGRNSFRSRGVGQRSRRAHRRRQAARARRRRWAASCGPRSSRFRASRCAARRRPSSRATSRFPVSTMAACSP